MVSARCCSSSSEAKISSVTILLTTKPAQSFTICAPCSLFNISRTPPIDCKLVSTKLILCSFCSWFWTLLAKVSISETIPSFAFNNSFLASSITLTRSSFFSWAVISIFDRSTSSSSSVWVNNPPWPISDTADSTYKRALATSINIVRSSSCSASSIDLSNSIFSCNTPLGTFFPNMARVSEICVIVAIMTCRVSLCSEPSANGEPSAAEEPSSESSLTLRTNTSNCSLTVAKSLKITPVTVSIKSALAPPMLALASSSSFSSGIMSSRL